MTPILAPPAPTTVAELTYAETDAAISALAEAAHYRSGGTTQRERDALTPLLTWRGIRGTERDVLQRLVDGDADYPLDAPRASVLYELALRLPRPAKPSDAAGQQLAAETLAPLLSLGLPACTWVLYDHDTSSIKGLAPDAAAVHAWADAMDGAELQVNDYGHGQGTLNAYATLSGVRVRVWTELSTLNGAAAVTG